MEKDYFKDRPEECRKKSFLNTGNEAFICLKSMQKTANTLSDLTRITITEHLTNQEYHPRGCKLKGYCYERDLFGNIKYNNGLLLNSVVGRCTYPIIDNKVITSLGSQIIVFNNKLELVLPDKIGLDLYNLVVVFNYNEIILDCLINPYQFLTKEKLSKEISSLNLYSSYFTGEYIILNKENYQIAIKPFCYKINGTDINYNSFSEYITAQYLSKKFKISLTPIEWYGIRNF